MPGGIMIAIIGVSAIGFAFGVSDLDLRLSPPLSIAPTLGQMEFSFLTSGDGLSAIAAVVFVFLFVDLFDTTGTLVGLAQRAGMLDERGRLPRSSRALLADSSATVVGAVLGTSTTTSYIESASGIESGGRTGLVAYASIKLLSGKWRDLNPAIVVVAALAAIKFAFYA